MATDIVERPLPPGWSQKFHQETGRMYFINHETKTTSWDDPRQTSIVVEASGEQDSISSLHDHGDLFEMFNIDKRWLADGKSEAGASSMGRRSDQVARGQLETLFSSSPSTKTRTPSPITAPGHKDARKANVVISMSDQILASATSTSVSDSPASFHRAGVDQSLTAFSAPDPQSLIQPAPAANPATVLQRAEIANAPQERMTTGEPPAAESLPSRTQDNPFEGMPQGQTAPSQSSPPSFGSGSRSKATNGTTTGLKSWTTGAKSDYKPRATLAKGADSSLRKGPNDWCKE